MKALFICGEPDSVAIPYRLLPFVNAMRSLGIDSEWMTIPDAVRQTSDVKRSNLLLLWRTAWDGSVEEIVKAARSNGASIIFDADDLVIEPHLARIGVIDGIRSQGLSEQEVETYFRRTLASFEASDFACCSTEEIAGFMRARGKTTTVLPNGFDEPTHAQSRDAVLRRSNSESDGLLRIGYATGSRTHQRDFSVAAPSLAQVLRARKTCRLVLFRDLLDLSEFPALLDLDSQIEWRTFVPPEKLPEEFARFDVSIAPLEVGNPFCGSKSELKFVQAGLVEICTVASPTGPFWRAIREGETGFLPRDESSWTSTLLRLLDDAELRRRIGRAAYAEVVAGYGPELRRERIAAALPTWRKSPTRP